MRSVGVWMAASRFRIAMLAGWSAAMLGGVLVVWFALASPRQPPARLAWATVLEALDQGHNAEAKQLALSFSQQGSAPGEPAGGAAYVLGLVTAREAEKAIGSQKRRLYLAAAAYLRQARSLGLPPDRAAGAWLLWGQCLYLAGQAEASRPVLQEALKRNPHRAPWIHQLLAAANLSGPTPEPAEALKHNALYLADPRLSRPQRYRGMLQRAEILLQLGRPAESLKTLEQMPAADQQRAETLVLRGQVLIQQARSLEHDPASPDLRHAAQQKYDEAMLVLRRAEAQQSANTLTGRKAMYLIGLCLLETGDARGALHQFVRTRATEAESPEVFAANFQEAELYRQVGRYDEALAAYGRAFRSVADVQSYHNPYLPLEQVRRRTAEAYQQALDGRHYRWCLGLTELLPPVFSHDRAMQLAAETHRAWGHDLLARSEQAPAARAAALEKQARAHLRTAGQLYQRLARGRFSTRYYPDDVWESAQAYLEGHDYRAAARLFQRYLKEESRRRHAQAWTNLGESFLALDRGDEALAAFARCLLLYPEDAASFRARLLAAHAWIEKGNFQQAEQLLQQNLQSGLLTPASKEWRDSLFALGELLYRSGRHQEAILRLEEAVTRYGNSRQALGARYLLADALRQQAQAQAARLAEEVVPSARAARAKQVRDGLEAAVQQYRQTQELLLQTRQMGELTPLQSAMLRNCLFAVGSLLVELGQYEAAIANYTLLANRYQDSPEALEAYVAIARTYRLLNKPAEARAALEQAKTALGRIRPQVALQETTTRTRQEWAEYLNQLAGAKSG
ncbi:MAG: tetratricopeptide repeat protein [Thermoguttaceae bacterium]